MLNTAWPDPKSLLSGKQTQKKHTHNKGCFFSQKQQNKTYFLDIEMFFNNIHFPSSLQFYKTSLGFSDLTIGGSVTHPHMI